MKYKKILMVIIVFVILLSTGCFRSDDMEDINIVTTNYPIEYAIKRLYGENATVNNIYPYGVSKDEYSLTKKQLKDFSKNDLLIYDGNSKDKDDVLKMLKYNSDLMIIDATNDIIVGSKISDVWLDLSDYLMLVQNIKNELKDYISDPFLSDDLDKKYDLLEVDVTSLESLFNQVANNSVNKEIVCIDETMNFLDKYGLSVISLTESGKNKATNIDYVKQLLEEDKIDYIFVTDENLENEVTKDLVANYDVKLLTFKTLATISEKDLNSNEDFLTIMQDNINLIAQETYE